MVGQLQHGWRQGSNLWVQEDCIAKLAMASKILKALNKEVGIDMNT